MALKKEDIFLFLVIATYMVRLTFFLICASQILPTFAQEKSINHRHGLGLEFGMSIDKYQDHGTGVVRFQVAPTYLFSRKSNVFYQVSVPILYANILTENTDRKFTDSELETALSFGIQRSWFLSNRWILQGVPNATIGYNRSASNTLFKQSNQTFEISSSYGFAKIEVPFGLGYSFDGGVILTGKVNLLSVRYVKGEQTALNTTMILNRLYFDTQNIGRLTFGLYYYFGESSEG